MRQRHIEMLMMVPQWEQKPLQEGWGGGLREVDGFCILAWISIVLFYFTF